MPCPLAGVGVQAQLPGGPVAVVCLQRQHLGKERRAGVPGQGLRVRVVSGGVVRQHDQARTQNKTAGQCLLLQHATLMQTSASSWQEP